MEAIHLDDRPHILLAEDDPELRELLRFVLVRAGYRVTVCGNGLQLLEQLEWAEEYDLVISDVRMPAFTGLEVLESQLDNPVRPPFICMTAFGDDLTYECARKLGATATIDKPFDLDRIIALAHTVCLRKEKKNLSLRSQK
ncbi:response regulator [Pelobacter seleniigenes]|uniref:response regulator n=1 Tax=Pelobacter seleniigenes TaxID=407188 RepID=UPI00068CB586|nr:response regulator [Pelobacter seleniigenes]